MINSILFSFFLIFCLSFQGFSDEVKVQLNRTKVNLNESFSLTFIASQKSKGNPDFTNLKQDFDVLSNSVQMSTSIVNGQVTEEMRWTLNLMAKHEGLLTIPSISFGDENSAEKTIEVASATETKTDEALFIETEIKPEEVVFVQTPFIYTIRLYSSLQINHGSLSDLTTSDPDALIERIDEDRHYETFYQNGKRYLVVERKYRVTPQHLGELTIYPTQFDGSIVTRGYSLFDVQTAFKRAVSSEKKIDVKNIPPAFSLEEWFAANHFTIEDEWSENLNQVELGDSLTWTLKLQAEGAFAEQIPDISFHFPKEFKFYLDKPELSNTITEEGVKGVKMIKLALIPSKPGTYKLPKLKIKWWDLKNERVQEFLLKEKEIHVLDGENSSQEIASIAPLKEMNPQSLSAIEDFSEPSKETQGFPYALLLGVALGIVGLTTLVAVYYKMKAKRRVTKPSKNFNQALKRACFANDAKIVEKNFLACMGELFPDVKPLNLMTVKPLLSEDLQVSVDMLYQALYGLNQQFDGQTFWKNFVSYKPLKKVKTKPKKRAFLMESLYPNNF